MSGNSNDHLDLAMSSDGFYKGSTMIPKLAGWAKYRLCEDDEKIELKRLLRNSLFWFLIYLVAILYFFLIFMKYLRVPFVLNLLFVAVGLSLAVWKVISIARKKYVILKKEQRIAVYNGQKVKRYPLNCGNATVQRMDKNNYALFFNKDAVLFLRKKRPEYERVMDYLKSIGYIEINQRWIYRDGKK